MEEVDLNVRLRKVPPKEPVVLDVQELLALIDKVTNPYQLAAKLQCGAGLRRQELVTLIAREPEAMPHHDVLRQRATQDPQRAGRHERHRDRARHQGQPRDGHAAPGHRLGRRANLLRDVVRGSVSIWKELDRRRE